MDERSSNLQPKISANGEWAPDIVEQKLLAADVCETIDRAGIGRSFYEFFAGGGMARAGLGSHWKCVFANDIDRKKAAAYIENWGADALKIADVASLGLEDLPGHADLAWASFPCQDLSLAGVGAGLKGGRSGTFWPFWKLIEGLAKADRAPNLVVLENVCGTLTSHGGQDFAAICLAFAGIGYRCGALIVDATLFVPQSRPRLFVIGARGSAILPSQTVSHFPSDWHPRSLQAAFERLPAAAKQNWIWWNPPKPQTRKANFADLIESSPASVRWHTKAETDQLIAMMSEVNVAKLVAAKRAGRRMVGAIYKRTRRNHLGERIQRAEVRFDDVAGCLRTPAGGSSRQLIVVVDGEVVRSRLISSRETARLMGLPDTYILPENYNDAYHLTGDGVVPPVVRHIARHLLEPILDRNQRGERPSRSAA